MTPRRALLATQRNHRSEARQLARTRRAATRRAAREAATRKLVDEAQIRRRLAGVAAPSAIASPADRSIHRIHPPRPCYVCKAPYDLLHFFYDRLCPTCAAESYTRRADHVDRLGALFRGAGDE